MAIVKNVLGENLQTCCTAPVTGFYRDGTCNTSPEDLGVHTVCAEMTVAFLAFSQAQGNDLTTPMPLYQFPGLRPGDRWCLCAARWQEALEAGVAPKVILEATHEKTLQYVSLETLKEYSR